MKRSLPVIAALLAGTVGLVAANLPNIPSTAQFAEANQIVGTLNALISQLNGGTGYSGTSQIVSLGVGCTGTSVTSTVVCSGQRGVATVTGQTLAAATNFPVTITNTATSANNVCTASPGVSPAAGVGPSIVAVTPAAGSMTVTFFSTAGGAQTLTTNFICM